LPSATTEARVGLTNSPAESARAVTTTAERVAATEPTIKGVKVRTDDAARFRTDGRIRIIVRPGDRLLNMCRSVYGTCDSATLRRVLKSNPRIRSARFIVSGETVVFPTHPSARSGSDKQ
jgi:phage tail protein X